MRAGTAKLSKAYIKAAADRALLQQEVQHWPLEIGQRAKILVALRKMAPEHIERHLYSIRKVQAEIVKAALALDGV